ncbi:MAG: PAS domain S-box protein [Dehalococcoidia bacterium]|nr:PAS domain S-box protein [Dehalococcoidia bacterium]
MSVFYRVLLGIVILAGIYLTSLYSFLLFHITIELLSIIICLSIFIVAWNSRNYTDNNYFTFLGIAYLFIGIIELLHTLTYDGMPFFTEFNTNVQTQLWIAARYIQSLSLLAAIIFIKRKLRINIALAVFTVFLGIIILSIMFWQNFPVAYIPGQGLTLFKVSSEFIVCSILMIAGALLWIKKDSFDRSVLMNIMMSIAFGIMAELSFMLYRDSTNVFYMLGHLFYIVSFFLIYRAITVTGLQKPYNILFRNLANSHDLLQRERNKLQNILDLVESIMLALDLEGQVTLINRKGCEIIGTGEREIMGKKWFDTFVPERVRQEASSYFNHFINGQASQDKYYNNPVVNIHGEERLIAWHNELLKDETGKIIGSFSSGQDITERKQAQEMFQAIFNTSPVGMYIAQDHQFRLVNPQFISYVAYPEQELIGKDTLSLVEPEDRNSVRKNAIKALKSGRGQYSTYDYRVKTRSGKQVWFMESDTSILYNGKKATLGTIVDISERKQSEELFKSLSLIDDLTGLYNRRGFLMLATKQLKLSNRLNRGVTVLFADIDRLKWINDNLGHVEGDLALINTAKILKETFRDSDIVARMHGDEFAVFMAGSDETFSETVKSRLTDKISEFNISAKMPYELSLSTGISSSEAGQPCNLNELLDKADQLMYEAKRQNR